MHKDNEEAYQKAPVRIDKLRQKIKDDPKHAKKYRRQLRSLGFFLSKENLNGIPEEEA